MALLLAALLGGPTAGASAWASTPGSATPRWQAATSANASAASADHDSTAARDDLFDLLDEERRERGLPPLERRGDVEGIADEHSGEMARSRTLRHNEEYFSAESKQRLGAEMVGENVALGPSIESIHERLMRSADHRAIILDPRFTVVGLGAVRDVDGWWVTEDFVQPRG